MRTMEMRGEAHGNVSWNASLLSNAGGSRVLDTTESEVPIDFFTAAGRVGSIGPVPFSVV
jgi:hypothetical protein